MAFDMNGNIVAGTSTGGMTNKKRGRIGDAPIIEAGTYATLKHAEFRQKVGENILLEMLSLMIYQQ